MPAASPWQPSVVRPWLFCALVVAWCATFVMSVVLSPLRCVERPFDELDEVVGVILVEGRWHASEFRQGRVALMLTPPANWIRWGALLAITLVVELRFARHVRVRQWRWWILGAVLAGHAFVVLAYLVFPFRIR